MDPEEISRLAKEAKKKNKAVQAEAPKKPEYNPLDWMDFKLTKKWMSHNLALSDRFYSFLVWVLLACGLMTWIWLQDFNTEIFYGMTCLWIFCFMVIIFGFIYGYRKAKANRRHHS